MDFQEKLQQFAKTLEEQIIANLHRQDLACEGNIRNARVSIKPGKKYTKVDVGTSGRYMVENETEQIFGIKGYGVIHRGHYFGTLSTVDEYFWGGYRAGRKAA